MPTGIKCAYCHEQIQNGDVVNVSERDLFHSNFGKIGKMKDCISHIIDEPTYPGYVFFRRKLYSADDVASLEPPSDFTVIKNSEFNGEKIKGKLERLLKLNPVFAIN